MAVFISKCKELKLWLRPPQQISMAGWVPTEDGLSVEFREGRYETDDEEILEYLRKHKLNGASAGFFEEPGPQEPSVRDQFLAIGKAANDPEGIQAVLDVETETYNREVVLKAGREALEALAAGSEEESSTSDASERE